MALCITGAALAMSTGTSETQKVSAEQYNGLAKTHLLTKVTGVLHGNFLAAPPAVPSDENQRKTELKGLQRSPLSSDQVHTHGAGHHSRHVLDLLPLIHSDLLLSPIGDLPFGFKQNIFLLQLKPASARHGHFGKKGDGGFSEGRRNEIRAAGGKSSALAKWLSPRS